MVISVHTKVLSKTVMANALVHIPGDKHSEGMAFWKTHATYMPKLTFYRPYALPAHIF